MGVGRRGKTGAHLARWPGPPQTPGSGSLGSGTLGGPGATCSARAVRAEARAQSPPGGDCAPARCDLPRPHSLPGALAARGRERAASVSTVGRLGPTRQTGAPGRLSGRRPGPLDACVGRRPSHTGWKKLEGVRATAMALPFARCSWTEELEAGREMGRSGPRSSERERPRA